MRGHHGRPPRDLETLNARVLHALPFAAAAPRLAAAGLADADEHFWLAVRGNLVTLADAARWAEVVRGPVEPKIEDADFLTDAATKLPPEPWDETTWKAFTSTLGRKGRALFHPLRLALTARETGPEMARLLPLIGRTKAEARLRGKPA